MPVLIESEGEKTPGAMAERAGKGKRGTLADRVFRVPPPPHVQSASGSLLYHYGLTHTEYYTVTFGTSRSIGALSQLVWDRALGLPIERPKSLSMEAILKLVK